MPLSQSIFASLRHSVVALNFKDYRGRDTPLTVDVCPTYGVSLFLHELKMSGYNSLER